MSDEEIRICPKCKKCYSDYPALSRYDNKTYICPECGMREAIELWNKAMLKEKEKKNE